MWKCGQNVHRFTIFQYGKSLKPHSAAVKVWWILLHENQIFSLAENTINKEEWSDQYIFSTCHGQNANPSIH